MDILFHIGIELTFQILICIHYQAQVSPDLLPEVKGRPLSTDRIWILQKLQYPMFLENWPHIIETWLTIFSSQTIRNHK
jgi:hypothetical protein